MIIGPANHRTTFLMRMACVGVMCAAGCNAAARVQLSAADSLEAIMRSVELATTEYHDEIRAADALRRQMAIDAFVNRIRDGRDDEQATEVRVAQFTAALDHLRQDGETEGTRYLATIQNIRTLRDIGDGLKRLAVESMTLDDELRRYVTDLIQPLDTPHNQSTPLTMDQP